MAAPRTATKNNKPRIDNVTLEGVRLVFRNFAGKGDQYNREGNRNFSVVLPDDIAEKMKRDGWNVKTKPPREEGEDNFNTLNVTVRYDNVPPRVTLITSRGRNQLDESTIDTLDFAYIENADLMLTASWWEVNGNSGFKAYLSKAFITIREDELDRKYAGMNDEPYGQPF